MLIGKVKFGPFWNRKSYYRFYNAVDDHYDLIEKSFFDSLPVEKKKWLIERKSMDAFQRYVVKQCKGE